MAGAGSLLEGVSLEGAADVIWATGSVELDVLLVHEADRPSVVILERLGHALDTNMPPVDSGSGPAAGLGGNASR